ncbi:MAG: hypothetical protein U1D99_03760 [Candidatus Omnitrophota bacterium]|nr:hypothetical protein [Candidatus Omnitrophota bacterium]
MISEVPIHLCHYDSEPHLPVVGGPLFVAYCAYRNGLEGPCRQMIADFLVSVYESRPAEFSTERFVKEICLERGIPAPVKRSETPLDILREAALRRYDRLHLPVLESILSQGYRPELGSYLTATEAFGKYLIGDGKNRSSILAALGEKTIPRVKVTT